MLNTDVMQEIKKLSEQIGQLTESQEEKTSKVFCSIAEKDFLTVSEACAYLSVSSNTLAKWREQGLKYVKIGDGSTKMYFSKKQLEEFLLKFEC